MTTVLAGTLSFLRRYGTRIGVVVGTFVLVAGLIFVQQMREAFAEQDFQAERTQALAAQNHASELGLELAEISDLQRQEMTTASETPPIASAPFNEQRISFFNRAASQEAQIKEQLDTRVQKLLAQTGMTIGDVDEMMHDLAGYTPFAGRKLKGWPVSVLSRGRVIIDGNKCLASAGSGQFLARSGGEADCLRRAQIVRAARGRSARRGRTSGRRRGASRCRNRLPQSVIPGSTPIASYACHAEACTAE